MDKDTYIFLFQYTDAGRKHANPADARQRMETIVSSLSGTLGGELVGPIYCKHPRRVRLCCGSPGSPPSAPSSCSSAEISC